jgi:hypothetical protein
MGKNAIFGGVYPDESLDRVSAHSGPAFLLQLVNSRLDGQAGAGSAFLNLPFFSMAG